MAQFYYLYGSQEMSNGECLANGPEPLVFLWNTVCPSLAMQESRKSANGINFYFFEPKPDLRVLYSVYIC